MQEKGVPIIKSNDFHNTLMYVLHFLPFSETFLCNFFTKRQKKKKNASKKNGVKTISINQRQKICTTKSLLASAVTLLLCNRYCTLPSYTESGSIPTGCMFSISVHQNKTNVVPKN